MNSHDTPEPTDSLFFADMPKNAVFIWSGTIGHVPEPGAPCYEQPDGQWISAPFGQPQAGLRVGHRKRDGDVHIDGRILTAAEITSAVPPETATPEQVAQMRADFDACYFHAQFGPGHLVFADDNIEDHHINWCLALADGVLSGNHHEECVCRRPELQGHLCAYEDAANGMHREIIQGSRDMLAWLLRVPAPVRTAGWNADVSQHPINEQPGTTDTKEEA